MIISVIQQITTNIVYMMEEIVVKEHVVKIVQNITFLTLIAYVVQIHTIAYLKTLHVIIVKTENVKLLCHNVIQKMNIF